MNRTTLIAAVAGLVGFVAGNAFWYLASPLWIDNVVAESVSAAATETKLAEGRFRDTDAVHKGKGTAAIYAGTDGRRIVRLTAFEVTNGPDLEVWLSAHPDIKQSADVTGGPYLSLGRLKGNIGDQTYDIPADTDLAKFKSVVIWCEQFGVLFSAAPLGS